MSAEDWKEMYGNLDNFIHPEAATGKAVVRQDIAAPAFNKSILEERYHEARGAAGCLN